MRKLILIAIILSSTSTFAVVGNNGGGNGGCGVGQTTNGCGGSPAVGNTTYRTTNKYDNRNYSTNQSQGQYQSSNSRSNANSSSNASGGNASSGVNNVGNTSIDNSGLPPAPPAVAPTMIGMPGSSSVSGGVSTPFGGVSFGSSTTIPEARRMINAQATAQDIANLKAADGLDPEQRLRVIRHIMRKYR